MPEQQHGEYVRYHRIDSSDYPLINETKVSGVGPITPIIDIAFVGKAPTKQDAEAKLPFSDPTYGKYLKGFMSEAGIGPESVYYTNVVDRGAWDVPEWQYKETLVAQTSQFWEEMRWLKSKGVKVVVALGQEAANAFGITESLTKTRGSIYEIDLNWEGVVTDPFGEPCDFVVIPTYSPQQLKRSGGRQRKSGSVSANQLTTWVSDLKKAQDLRLHGYKRPVERFNIKPTLDEVLSFVDEVTKNNTPVAVDIETSGLDPKRDKVICIGMATSSEDAICIPIYETGKDVARLTHYWSTGQQQRVKIAVEKVLTQCPLLLQNAVFDLGYLSNAGWNTQLRPEHDTLLLDHAIDPEQTHKLGDIVSRYGATPYWKGEFNFRKTSIWEMDPKELRDYNCRDCIVIHQVLDPMLKALKEEGTEVAYTDNLDMVPVIIHMQSTGVPVSKSRLQSFKKSLESSIDEAKEKLYELGNLPEGFNINSDDDVRLLLYGYMSPKFKAASSYTKHKPATKVYQNKKKLHGVATGTKTMWVPKKWKSTDSGVPSVSKDGLLSYRVDGQNRLDQIKKLKKPTHDHLAERALIEKSIQWTELFNEYKVYEKMYTTYTSYPIKADGRVHPSYLIHGTSTSRLSSNNPNLQQQPKKNKELRKIFIAPAGHTIVSADYSNLEFRCMAYETQEPSMLAVIENGLNMHDENTKSLFNIDESHPQWELHRRAAKIFQFASQYGGGPRTIYEKVLNEVPGLRLTYSDFMKSVDKWYAEKPVYNQWCTQIKEQAKTDRCVWNSFGRNRTLYGYEREIENQALNFPIQSSAAYIINKASVLIYKRIVDEGWQAAIQTQIHDQLVFEVDTDQLDSFIREIVIPEMTRPFQWHGRLAEFPVDVEVGPSWGELKAWA